MRSFFFLLLVVSLAACSKDPVNNLSGAESNVYTTSRDTTVNFRNYRTFSISDSIFIRRQDGTQYASAERDRAFIEAFRQNMRSRGFSEVPRGSSPDLGVQISLVISTSVGVVALPDIWGGWNSGFWGPYPGYGWGYGPGWGWGGGYSTYRVTTALMTADIFDLRNAGTNGNLRVLWNGVIQGDEVYNPNTATTQIGQLFAQSPYLTAQ